MARVSRDNRLRIIQLHESGISHRAISGMVGCAVSTVLRIVHAYRDEGRIADAPRGGRRSSTTPEEDLMIIAAVVDEPFISGAEIKRELGIGAHESTIRRRLLMAGLTCWNANTKPRLTPRLKQVRFNFASEYRHWTAEQWQGVVFTNESTICCKWDRNRDAWRPLHNWHDPIYVRQLAASGHVSLNVWTMATYQGLGPIHRVEEESLSPEEYISIIDNVMLPFLLDGPFPDGTFILQQDPAPIYKTKSVQQHLNQLGIRRVQWAKKCEDLNPIRGAWALVKERICRKRIKDPSAEKLWALFKKEWDKLRELPTIVSGYYASLPEKMVHVVAAGGGVISSRETGQDKIPVCPSAVAVSDDVVSASEESRHNRTLLDCSGGSGAR